MPDRSTALTKARARRNKLLPCAISGCPWRRLFTSRFCASHKRRLTFHGHPKARAIHPNQYQPYLLRARRLFESHQEHPAHLAALRCMTTLLQPGREPPRRGNTASGKSSEWLVWRELGRLAEGKVTAQEALEKVTALFLMAHHEPINLLDDVRLTYAIGHALCRLRPYRASWLWDHAKQKSVIHRRTVPAGIAVRILGERIRTTLGPFFRNVAVAVPDPFTNTHQEHLTS